MVVTDRLLKLRHYIPAKKIDATATAKLFLSHVYKHHGLPTKIVSDRGTQFTSAFHKRLLQRLGITSAKSTAFHPQSDGQSEISNQFIEQYLRAYTNHLQDDWVEWLPIAEFAANNHVSETTKMTPFFATYGYHPRMDFNHEPMKIAVAGAARFTTGKAEEFADDMERLHQVLRQEIAWAQTRYEQRSASKAVTTIRVGDQVWLDARHLRTDRPAKKLDSKNLGPFEVIEQINPRAFRL